MARQNIFDNDIFFDGYSKIRERKNNANELFEKPALFSLLPPLEGKTVIDLGCGYGEHCMEYVRRGTAKVVGIDISEKMLAVAKSENSHPKITYLHMAMEDISSIKDRFDMASSSLAIHYVEDYQALANDVHELLKDNGLFVFSQEHPMNTCFSEGENPSISTFVLSHMNIRTPSRPSSPSLWRLIVLPLIGVKSILKSPEWTIVPTGVLSAIA